MNKVLKNKRGLELVTSWSSDHETSSEKFLYLLYGHSQKCVHNADISRSFYIIKYWAPCLSWENVNLISEITQIIFLANSESPIFLDAVQENWNFFQGNDNTRCNKINQMAAVRMAWYSLIFKHKSAFRSKSECLMNLDNQSWEIELWRNHILTSVWLQF